MTVHCRVCQHQWVLPLKLPMPMGRFTVALRGFSAAGCPACGAHGREVLCGPAVAATSLDVVGTTGSKATTETRTP